MFKNEFEKMDEKLREDVKEIQEWLGNQKFLPRDLSQEFIHTFLYGCRRDKNVAKGVLANYFYARQSIPEIFTNRDPLAKENVEVWKGSCFGPLAGTQNRCMVFLASITDSEHYTFAGFARQVFMCYDLMIKLNEWGNGDRMMVIGYNDATFQNLAGYTFYLTRKVAECERERYLPGRLKAVHAVNLPDYAESIHSLFKPFLNPGKIKVVCFHKSLDSLHKHVDRNLLPDEYEGTAGPLKEMADKWYEKFAQNREFFLSEEAKRAEECKAHVASRRRSTVPKIITNNK